jgi:hypothetical protein
MRGGEGEVGNREETGGREVEGFTPNFSGLIEKIHLPLYL